MSNLLNETLQLAKNTDLPVLDICREADIKPRWFHRFVSGDFKEPGVAKIERLNKVLKARAISSKRYTARRKSA